MEIVDLSSRPGGSLQAKETLELVSPSLLERHAPDTHRMVLDSRGLVCARCSLWWSQTPPSVEGHQLGVIGHFASVRSDAAEYLLEDACRELASHGASLAVGPMDGNTWRSYRLITERGTEPPFFLELDHPSSWPDHFRAAGFVSLAGYVSTLNPDLKVENARTPEREERAAEAEIDFRPLDGDRFEEELQALYAVAVVSFRDNYLYTPLTQGEFVEQYLPVRPYVEPRLVLLAERRGEPVGFIFAVPDVLQAKRGKPVDTVILKTLGVLPELRGLGLGSLMTALCQRQARELGYRRAIHALMIAGNASTKISSRFARPIRRYTLFAKPLAAETNAPNLP